MIDEHLTLFFKDFITRADDDIARLERLDGEMTHSYQNLCDFLAIDPKNYSLTEFFTDLKSFCSFFSVSSFSFVFDFSTSSFFFRHVFKKYEHGVNKQQEQSKRRKYLFLCPVESLSKEYEKPVTSFSKGLPGLVKTSCLHPNTLSVHLRVVFRLVRIRSKISFWPLPKVVHPPLVVLLHRFPIVDR